MKINNFSLKNFFSVKNRRLNRSIDFRLILITLLLSLLGILIISTATKSYGTLNYVKKQSIATAVGVVTMIVFMLIDYQLWKRIYPLIYLTSVLLLAATLLFGHGELTWGARSWLKIGPVNFQPAEFVKVGLILSFAAWLEKHDGQINRPLTLIKALVFMGIPMGLISVQPDFGTTMVVLFITATMLFFAEIDWKYILSALGLGLASIPFIYMSLGEYQKNRILDFLRPSENLSGSGYQANEGKIAIGSGRLFGKGLYQGSQTQYNYIPTKETDYIFPVLVEELGFLGGALLIFLYAALLSRILKIAKLSRDQMGTYVSAGFLALFFIHIWENMGMTLGLMPLTGIPLPFMSYGGSFQLVNYISIGLLLSIFYHRKREPLTAGSSGFENYILSHYDRLMDRLDKRVLRDYRNRR